VLLARSRLSPGPCAAGHRARSGLARKSSAHRQNAAVLPCSVSLSRLESHQNVADRARPVRPEIDGLMKLSEYSTQCLAVVRIGGIRHHRLGTAKAQVSPVLSAGTLQPGASLRIRASRRARPTASRGLAGLRAFPRIFSFFLLPVRLCRSWSRCSLWHC
jgi:hypothetical protein